MSAPRHSGPVPVERRSAATRALPGAAATRDVETRLAGIRRAFLARSAEQLRALEAIAPDSIDEAVRAEVTATVHRLAGASGTFGYAAVSRVAGALEDALRGEGTATDDVADLLDEHLPHLALALAHAATEEGPAPYDGSTASAAGSQS